MRRPIDKTNYYRLFNELAALGRLRRLREQKQMDGAIQEKQLSTQANESEKKKENG